MLRQDMLVNAQPRLATKYSDNAQSLWVNAQTKCVSKYSDKVFCLMFSQDEQVNAQTRLAGEC